MLRATQLQPHMRHGLTEHRGMLQLAAGEQSVQRFKVRPGLTLEVTLAQFWNSLGSSQLSVQVGLRAAAWPDACAVMLGVWVCCGVRISSQGVAVRLQAKAQFRSTLLGGTAMHGLVVIIGRRKL